VLERPERRSRLAPVRVPALRLDELWTQPVDRAGASEAAGVRQLREEQPQQKSSAPDALSGGELGAPVHPGLEHDRNLSDASAVTTQNEEAFEKERVGAGRHELEKLARDPPQVVELRDAGTMRTADAELALPMDHRDPRVLAREPIERRAGAIGRAIVDEEDVRVQRKRPEFRAEPLDVAVLVVGRDEDEETGGRHRCDVETTSIEGRGNISLPPAAR